MEYKSNVNEVILNLKAKLLSNESQQDLIKTIAQNLYQSNSHRVFNEGKNINGSGIGRYSRTAAYFNPKISKKSFKVGGKENKKGNTGTYSIKTQKANTSVEYFKNGKKRKTKYFAGGYANLRNALGKRIDIVDLNFNGTLQANFQNVKIDNGYGIGFLSSKKGLIAEGLEDHFKCKIFGVTDNDKTNINNIVKNWTNKV